MSRQRSARSRNNSSSTKSGRLVDLRTLSLSLELVPMSLAMRSTSHSRKTERIWPILAVCGSHGVACGAGDTVIRFTLNSPVFQLPLRVGLLEDVLQFSRLWPLLSISSWDSLLASGKLNSLQPSCPSDSLALRS